MIKFRCGRESDLLDDLGIPSLESLDHVVGLWVPGGAKRSSMFRLAQPNPVHGWPSVFRPAKAICATIAVINRCQLT